jgi:4-hydroxybenzoate polyprenyltransferase
MIVKLDLAGLKETTWRQYLIRFIFGGLVTAIAGGIGKEWGPVVAGLFLAFPAIFPASATLVEKHERERKEREGLHGERRGMEAAAADALGAAIGSIGLLAFAAICWLLIPRYSPLLVLAGATLAWFLVAGSIWILRKRGWRHFAR